MLGLETRKVLSTIMWRHLPQKALFFEHPIRYVYSVTNVPASIGSYGGSLGSNTMFGPKGESMLTQII
jgi:hypothetical protein